jgi:transposase
MSAPVSRPRSIQLIEAVAERFDGAPVSSRRRWSDEFKAEAISASLEPGANISAVARRMGIAPSQLFAWRRQARDFTSSAPTGVPSEPAVKPEPMAEIVIGSIVIRVGCEFGEAELRRLIRAVRSA